jgi:hypothetical protein
MIKNNDNAKNVIWIQRVLARVQWRPLNTVLVQDFVFHDHPSNRKLSQKVRSLGLCATEFVFLSQRMKQIFASNMLWEMAGQSELINIPLPSGTRWRSWLRHYATSRKVAG